MGTGKLAVHVALNTTNICCCFGRGFLQSFSFHHAIQFRPFEHMATRFMPNGSMTDEFEATPFP